MSCGTCGVQASGTMQGDTGVPAGAPSTSPGPGPHYCERCGQRLQPRRIVWLELDMHTGLYHRLGAVAEADSQGMFAFGPDCAARELARTTAGTPIPS